MRVVYLALAIVVGGVLMALCAQCKRTIAPSGMKLTKRWADAYRYCACAKEPDPVELTPDEKFVVWEMLTWVQNPVHEWCGRLTCEVCKR